MMSSTASEQHTTAANRIDVRGVEKVYDAQVGPIQALASVDLTIEGGSFVSLVGPSGCGKSTLLKCIAGLLPLTSGSIAYGDEPVEGPARSRGLMFQTPILFPWRTVLENVLLPTEVRGTEGSSEDHDARAEHVLEMVGLSGFKGAYPGELSGGMQQRVALCRLLVYDPPVLLMDEPFGALDEFTRERLNLELLDLWERTSKTVVFVTHSIPEAVLLSQKIVVMGTRPGHVIDTLEVGLPYPRTAETVTDHRFTDTVAEVRALLSDEGAGE